MDRTRLENIRHQANRLYTEIPGNDHVQREEVLLEIIGDARVLLRETLERGRSEQINGPV
jgi:hypothetical protein